MEQLEEAKITLKLLIFALENREYAIDVKYVQSIERLLPITRVPGTKPYIKGVANLRGSVFPIMDLAERLGSAPRTPSEDSRIIVTTIGEMEMGFIVDATHDVMDISSDQVEAPSQVLSQLEGDVIQGVAHLEERLILLLQLENIIHSDQQS